MYQTMTQIGKTYNVDAKTVGQVLYDLNIRDAGHPEHKGFPHEQAVIHGIAKAYTAPTGDLYYRYDIERIKEEFEARLKQLAAQTPPAKAPRTAPKQPGKNPAIEQKLEQMLGTLNTVLQTGEIAGIHRLKGDIADLYALLGART
jgi:hypothetical protein